MKSAAIHYYTTGSTTMTLTRTTSFHLHNATDDEFNATRSRLCRTHGNPDAPTVDQDNGPVREDGGLTVRWSFTRWTVPPVNDEDTHAVLLYRFY